MPGTFFDRFWPYPELSGQVFLLLKQKRQQNELLALIEAGHTREIEAWIVKTNPEDLVARLLRLGFPGSHGGGTPLFDEILIGTRSFQDGAGTVDHVLSRRVREQFYHRVYNDGPGQDVHRFKTDRPITRREFARLTRYPAPWEESGFEDEVADSIVQSIWDR